jgi:hypothetical protein
MVTALLLGLGLFAACWILHLVIWRIHRPHAYPIWLPVLFLVVPALAFAVALAAGVQLPPVGGPSLAAGLLVHVSLSACYMGSYAGIIEYSPSAEILRVVRGSMPQGLPVASLDVTSLSEAALTGKRIRHLRTSNMVRDDGNVIRLSRRGEMVVCVCKLMRKLWALEVEGPG